jgi:ERCC4-type nuclease
MKNLSRLPELRHFGSIHRISEASVEELAPFVGRKSATEITEHFARQRALAEGANGAA